MKKFNVFEPGFRIRIDLMRIRIQLFFIAEPDIAQDPGF